MKERRDMYYEGEIPAEDEQLKQILTDAGRLMKKLETQKQYSGQKLTASFKIENFLAQK